MQRRTDGRRDSGYMLLVLMLAVAVLTITMLGVEGNYRRSILRDREVEMIHRGVQYERAVRRYYLKFGGYPTTIEQLENTNKLRFLRKRYKDPMSPDGQWQIAHIADIKLPGVTNLAASLGTAATTPAAPQANAGDLSSAATAQAAQTTDSTNTGTVSSGSQQTASANSTGNGPVGTNGTGPLLGGGPMLGVISKSKLEGIHSFNDKSHYNEWYFIYAPSQEKGQQLTGPFNPNAVFGSTVTNNPTGVQTGSGSGQAGSSATPSSTPPITSTPVNAAPPTTNP
jgi:hypothetical protein